MYDNDRKPKCPSCDCGHRKPDWGHTKPTDGPGHGKHPCGTEKPIWNPGPGRPPCGPDPCGPHCGSGPRIW